MQAVENINVTRAYQTGLSHSRMSRDYITHYEDVLNLALRGRYPFAKH